MTVQSTELQGGRDVVVSQQVYLRQWMPQNRGATPLQWCSKTVVAVAVAVAVERQSRLPVAVNGAKRGTCT